MNRLFIICLFFYFSGSFGQSVPPEISGKWVKLKTVMKDGSKLFSRFEEDSSYISFTFEKKQLCINGNPTHKSNQSCFDFELINDFIKTSQYSGYLIEQITKDSLIISEKIEGRTDDKLRRYYLVKQETLFSLFKEKNKNSKHIVASKLYSPTTVSSVELDLNHAFTNNYSNFELSGSLILLPKEKRINTQITFATVSDSARIKTIRKVLNATYKKWDLGEFNDYESVELPFVLKSEITRKYWGVKLLFYTDDIDELDIVSGGSLEDLRIAGDYFTKGIEAYQDKKYFKASEYFTECYKKDPKNLDALYNKALVYYESGDLINACNVWAEIQKLGQVTGRNLHQKYCE